MGPSCTARTASLQYAAAAWCLRPIGGHLCAAGSCRGLQCVCGLNEASWSLRVDRGAGHQQGRVATRSPVLRTPRTGRQAVDRGTRPAVLRSTTANLIGCSGEGTTAHGCRLQGGWPEGRLARGRCGLGRNSVRALGAPALDVGHPASLHCSSTAAAGWLVWSLQECKKVLSQRRVQAIGQVQCAPKLLCPAQTELVKEHELGAGVPLRAILVLMVTVALGGRSSHTSCCHVSWINLHERGFCDILRTINGRVCSLCPVRVFRQATWLHCLRCGLGHGWLRCRCLRRVALHQLRAATKLHGGPLWGRSQHCSSLVRPGNQVRIRSKGRRLSKGSSWQRCRSAFFRTMNPHHL
mmetsp:Transcript_37979/g.108491  ORF Transcript_37979/g.108491 Transcript_37979/m.108491 type:complete len:352 (-) Transcript_37979:4-1059(-)